MSRTNAVSKEHISPQLPDLQPGITLLDSESAVDNPLHALAVDQTLVSGGEACWIDPGTHAQTAPLVSVAPADRILDRIHVARGFTPFQHLELLRSLPDFCPDGTELVVVPDIDRYYRDDSLLAEEGRDMLLSGLATVARLARDQNLVVLVTRTGEDEFSEPIEAAADRTLRCEPTPFGPRFRGPEEETLVYPVDHGQWLQTTLSFWERILAAREPLYTAVSGQQQEVSIRGAN